MKIILILLSVCCLLNGQVYGAYMTATLTTDSNNKSFLKNKVNAKVTSEMTFSASNKEGVPENTKVFSVISARPIRIQSTIVN